MGLAIALGSSTLAAQFERRYEVGLFGAFTKYDKAFGLADKIGGGVRFAYALGPALSLEIEALFQPPHNIPPSTEIEPVIGGGSLVFNVLNRDRLSFYVLGGYSRLDFGGTNPYRFTDGGIHGGAGVRFFFPSPEDGSACKRLNLYLRWMARHDSVDLGVWRAVDPAGLVIPLDAHIYTIARRVGLTRYRSPGWPMAHDITRRLRRLDPRDPIKYDFAFHRMGLWKREAEIASLRR